MRVLILGGNGMLGHAAWGVFKKDLDTYVTIRGSFSEVQEFGIFDKAKVICHFDASDFSSVEKKIRKAHPDVVLNCIGIVKQVEAAHEAIKSIEINSLFPHKLASLCAKINSRLIHLSTDCVFSGRKGNYSETDIPDPVDLYGRTKLLGEAEEGNTLTVRTSIIGRELKTKHGLLEWFLSQEGKTVKGYTKAIFSGLSTVRLSEILKNIILKHENLKGIYHISSAPISKFNLLMLIKKKFKLAAEVIPDDKIACDRSLNSSRFCKKTGYIPESWDDLVDSLLADEIKKGDQ